MSDPANTLLRMDWETGAVDLVDLNTGRSRRIQLPLPRVESINDQVEDRRGYLVAKDVTQDLSTNPAFADVVRMDSVVHLIDKPTAPLMIGLMRLNDLID